jgi:hypothetical protein
MTNTLFVALLLGLVVLLVCSARRARAAAARITAEPDPARVAVLQYEAIAFALANVEMLAEPPELKEKRRQSLLQQQRNLQLQLAA